MNNKILSLLALVISITVIQCSSQKKTSAAPNELYKTDALVVTQVAPNSFIHTSYKQTNDFGYVPCNGLVVRSGGEVIIFDTPTNDTNSAELIRWITDSLHCRIKAVIPTHFHDDCLGGLKAFHQHNIPSYAFFKTIELARANNHTVPQNSFSDSLVLEAGNDFIAAKHFGEGHTKDNVVGYFPKENVLFGGCLVKELKAGKGYLGDATLADWSATVERVKKAYPQVKIVVPGHGQYGNISLLDYTIGLFRVQ